MTEAEYHYLSKDEELKMALEHLNRLSEDERLEQEALSRDLSEMTQYLHEKGLREEGEAEGLAKGKAEGLAEGEKEGRLATAKQMLKEDFPLATISKITGLSDADIKRLKE